MRFSCVLVASSILLVPLSAPAQETEAEPAAEPAAELAAELAAEPEADETAPQLTASEAFAEDGTCPLAITSERAEGFGEPSARLSPTQSVHTPDGLDLRGNAISYVIVDRSAGGDGAVTRLTYRLANVNNTWGTDYEPGVRRLYDESFDQDSCTESGACMISFRGATKGGRAGAELSNRMPPIPPGAEGEAMPMLRADYNLEGADPVFLVCHYQD